MFEKLKKHWKVNGFNLALIISTFALGGSLCGFIGRKLLLLTGWEKDITWWLLYILLITLLWPICVLLISIPLGQFAFFKKYVAKIGRKIIGKHKNQTPVRIAVFASGAGSNAKKIIDHFSGSGIATVALVVCNNPDAGVLNIAKRSDIPSLLIKKENFFSGDHYLTALQQAGIDFIVLAGFLWKLPERLIRAYPQKIINIHPALLPNYGGKGMYGHFVHEAVLAAGEKESGITIHYVDEVYDHGQIIFQANCPIDQNETPESLAQKIHALEHAHYPTQIETLLKSKIAVK